MKKCLCLFVLFLGLILIFTACGAIPEKQQRYWHDMYPFGILSESEKAERKEIRDLVNATLPDSLKQLEYQIFIRKNRIETNILYSNENIKIVPDNWDNIVIEAKEIAVNLNSKIYQNHDCASVIYLSDKNRILLTITDGEIIFNLFNRAQRAKEKYDEQIPEKSIYNTNELEFYDTQFVYVSRTNTIHSIPDCSGMKYYTAMQKEDAELNGYKYCPNCW